MWNCGRKELRKKDCTEVKHFGGHIFIFKGQLNINNEKCIGQNSCQPSGLPILDEDKAEVNIPGTACCCVGDLCNGQGNGARNTGNLLDFVSVIAELLMTNKLGVIVSVPGLTREQHQAWLSQENCLWPCLWKQLIFFILFLLFLARQ